MADFILDPGFLTTSRPIGDLALCHARLHGDARYPWIVLIPRLAETWELEDLSPDDRVRLMDEIVLAGTAVRAVGEALGLPIDKLNVGLLGNITPQLHAHVVGRRVRDPAWPGPVWGHSAAHGHDAEMLAVAISAARRGLEL